MDQIVASHKMTIENTLISGWRWEGSCAMSGVLTSTRHIRCGCQGIMPHDDDQAFKQGASLSIIYRGFKLCKYCKREI